jgi:hypothetical protein
MNDKADQEKNTPPDPLNPDQRARVVAAQAARELLSARGPMLVAQADPEQVIQLAQWILDGGAELAERPAFLDPDDQQSQIHSLAAVLRRIGYDDRPPVAVAIDLYAQGARVPQLGGGN